MISFIRTNEMDEPKFKHIIGVDDDDLPFAEDQLIACLQLEAKVMRQKLMDLCLVVCDEHCPHIDTDEDATCDGCKAYSVCPSIHRKDTGGPWREYSSFV